MPQITNSETMQELVRAARLQSNAGIPNIVSSQFIPVIECNPRLTKVTNVCKQNIAVNATAATIYTTPTNQDFYITSALLSIIKDATATSIASTLAIVVNGAANELLRITGLTLTADAQTVQATFTTPIKVDRNSLIRVTNSTNNANVSACGLIQGYLDEAAS